MHEEREELFEVLARTRAEIFSEVAGTNAELTQSWDAARRVVEKFDPVPWFVRRLSQIALAREKIGQPVPRGAVVGLDRLLCQAASDPVIGNGKETTQVKQAFEILKADEFAAIAVVHSICRRLQTPKFQKMWAPLLDQALVRGQIGYCLATQNTSLGGGKGLLAGFVSKIGLLILMCDGTQVAGNRCLDRLMKGGDVSEIGLSLYGCDPLHVGACILAAVGCGGDSALGLIAYSARRTVDSLANQEQSNWVALLQAIEFIRLNRSEDVSEDLWKVLGYTDRVERLQVEDLAHIIKRRGHGWNWLL